uniref:collagen alpha-1(I) chain-like n=1 Tax=Gasterosteus aculeatus aculeatus TaxID=481459 RepID=UPI001A98046F|nr:collagen alpha-1(I) chain-like [Gasterosteus aculeatus aculeatus]
MLTQLVLGWTALLSSLRQPAVDTRFLSGRGSFPKCEVFPPPPPPPPAFPSVRQEAALMLDVTEHITGAKGEKGCRGPRGAKGKPGVTGPEAEPGAQGPMGEPGQKGDKGGRGWRGLCGDVGAAGLIKGSKGLRGFRGDKGVRGNTGPGGQKGEGGGAAAPGQKGDPGRWGDAGPRGEQGPRGEPGGRGTPGLEGSGGPAGGPGHPGPAGLSGPTGEPGLPGQVFVLAGLQGHTGRRGPSAECSCSLVRTPEPTVQTIFVAGGERQMRRLRAENVMVLRTDRGALYIYSDSQWISVLVRSGPAHNREGVVMADAVTSSLLCFGPGGPRALTPPPR